VLSAWLKRRGNVSVKQYVLVQGVVAFLEETTMLTEVACFAGGCIVGGGFVFRGMRAAMVRELKKRPWTEEEKGQRAQMLAEAATLSMQKDNPAAIRRSKELQRRLVDDDVRRGHA